MVLLEIGDVKNSMKKAFDTFLTSEERRNRILKKKLSWDIKLSYCKYLTTPDEYFLFNFRNSTDAKRSSFLSDKRRLRVLLRKTGEKLFVEDLCDKYNFFLKCGEYFKRKVFFFDVKTDERQFLDFALEVKHLFVKPLSGSFGKGIMKRFVDNEEEAVRLYAELRSKNSAFVVEEVISQCRQFSSLNESSVNTVRIPTFLTDKCFHVGIPVMRIGRKGSIVDNAGSGGIIVNIDPATGLLASDGVDEKGGHYVSHPDSGVVFKNFTIPCWKDLLELVEKIHRHKMLMHIYIGWDFTLSDAGWVLIEANWGQFLNQYVDHQGVKSEFLKYMRMNPYRIK